MSRDFDNCDIFTAAGQRLYIAKQVYQTVQRVVAPHYKISGSDYRSPTGERQKPNEYALWKDGNLVVQGSVDVVKARLAKIAATVKTKAAADAQARINDALADYRRGFYDEQYGKAVHTKADPGALHQGMLSIAQQITNVGTQAGRIEERYRDTIGDNRQYEMAHNSLYNAWRFARQAGTSIKPRSRNPQDIGYAVHVANTELPSIVQYLLNAARWRPDIKPELVPLIATASRLVRIAKMAQASILTHAQRERDTAGKHKSTRQRAKSQSRKLVPVSDSPHPMRTDIQIGDFIYASYAPHSIGKVMQMGGLRYGRRNGKPAYIGGYSVVLLRPGMPKDFIDESAARKVTPSVADKLRRGIPGLSKATRRPGGR